MQNPEPSVRHVQTPPPSGAHLDWRALYHPSSIVAWCLIVLFTVLLVEGRRYSFDARLFPTTVGWLGLALCAIFICGSVLSPRQRRDNAADMEESPGDSKGFWIACLSPPIYSFAIYLIGFHVSTLAALVAMPIMLGFRGIWRLLAIAVGVVALLHLVFISGVGIELPHGLLGNYLLNTFIYDK